MSKIEKLVKKLNNKTINAKELRALMIALGAELKGTRGSHERWYFNSRRYVLATHGKDLKEYQIKQAKEFLSV